MPSHRRLLLVEDDAMVSQTITMMLEERYEVSWAGTIRQALVCLDGPPPCSVILLDCRLPGGNIELLLQEADTRRIPVVLTSGHPGEAARIDQVRLFLAKPFNEAALLKVLDAAL